MKQRFDKQDGEQFSCCGCSKTIVVKNDEPKRRVFVWIDRNKRKKPYCFDCDDLLIQDQELPNEKLKRLSEQLESYFSANTNGVPPDRT